MSYAPVPQFAIGEGADDHLTPQARPKSSITYRRALIALGGLVIVLITFAGLRSVPSHAKTSVPTLSIQGTHREIFSNRTSDGKFFFIDFSPYNALNANLIPHPTEKDKWYAVAQLARPLTSRYLWYFTQLWCIASFQDDVMRCQGPVGFLPVGRTESTMCTDDIPWARIAKGSLGPHDARLFIGPDRPFIMYGSQSRYSCLGLFMTDFRTLAPWPYFERQNYEFWDMPVDLPRPPPVGPAQKNYFAFWSWNDPNITYIHHDVFPSRSFSRLEATEGPVKDLAVLTKSADDLCIARLMPNVNSTVKEHVVQSIHQATNSLAITLCRKKTDSPCEPTAENTFIMHILHHRFGYFLTAWYEPYVLLFRARPPFELYGISSKPFWINGRTHTDAKEADRNTAPSRTQDGFSEMFYITSMNWAAPGKNYSGYLDDEIFIGFGIADAKAGGLDVVAEDLLTGMQFCDPSDAITQKAPG